ncbi:MAG: YdhR family protein [Chloroflexota bacterium]
MSQKILQINFKFNSSRAEYEQVCLPLAQPIADVAGLRWKVWLMNEAGREAGGIYLFEDESSLQAFLSGPIVAGLGNDPSFSDISAKVFDPMEALSLITRAPIGERTRALP